ncbi:MAG: glycosyltransferase [Candidatus Micrarchaeia archaeon]
MPSTDGVVTSMLNFKKELERKGNTVYIFASSNSSLKNIRIKNVIIDKGMKFKKYPDYNISILPINSLIRFNLLNIDIIHLHTPFFMGFTGLLTAKFNKLPSISTFHTFFTDKTVMREYLWDFSRRMSLDKFSWPYARFFYNKCSQTIAPTKIVKDVLEKEQIQNVTVIPNGINLKRFNPHVKGKEIREKLINGKTEKLVLYVGRLSKEKKLETLLKAARYLDDDIKIVIGGKGPAEDYYKELAIKYKLTRKVSFVGYIKDSLLPKYYAASDLFCIPSTFETQGMVSLEAMAVGKPVVGADAFALKEIIQNGVNGEKFKPNDPKDCANKISKVINNIDAYKRAYKTAESYEISRVTDNLLNVYRNNINSG